METFLFIYTTLAAAWAVYSVHMYHVLPRYAALQKTWRISIQTYVINFIAFPYAAWLANKKKMLTVKQYNKHYLKKS